MYTTLYARKKMITPIAMVGKIAIKVVKKCYDHGYVCIISKSKQSIFFKTCTGSETIKMAMNKWYLIKSSEDKINQVWVHYQIIQNLLKAKKTDKWMNAYENTTWDQWCTIFF